ncbi:MAG: dephospho-CoA kinase, partial [Coriobacteriia bacterium]|nr:dephospho-CoA kinase [Coriobacteriia bacterium]
NTYSIPDSPGIRAPGKRTSDTFSERMGSACANPWTESGVTYGLLVIEIPLLAEASGFVGMADEVISVEADEELRLARAIKRGMDPQDAKNRLARQATDEQRRKIANVVIDNNGSLEALEQQVESWYTDRVNEHMFFSADS